jgi:adenylyltransferase/sulfurtransferase
MRGKGKHLVVLGAGNIGSHLVLLLARLGLVTGLTLVDFDRYEKKNWQSQAITPSDIGQAKARVQARRARCINPKLEVAAIVDRLENVPLGELRGDVILTCLDSKESRRYANEIAWRLGAPLIDAGVEPSQMLARVNVYLPAADQPCLECAWSDRDYADLATLHPCDAGGPKTPATNAPASLGALAAALQAIECQKLLAGQSAAALIGRQVVIEAATYRQLVTSFRRNPNCRFDHAIWPITPLRQSPMELTIGEALRLAQGASAAGALAFGGQPLVKRLDCPGCGFTRRTFRLQRRLQHNDRFCDRCGREMLSAGFHMKTRLSSADLGPGDADRSLASIGLRPGDVISLSNGTDERFFELCLVTSITTQRRKS